MSAKNRNKTNYPGVFYRIAARLGKGGDEKIYYIVFKKDGKVIEEKVGRQYADNMTPAKAAGIRAERIEGKRQSRKQIKEAEQATRLAAESKPVIDKLWEVYIQSSTGRKSIKDDVSRYNLYIKPIFGLKAPDEIYTIDIDKQRQKLLSDGKSPQTVKHILGLLRRLIRFGVKKGLCPLPDQSRLYFEMPKVDNEKTEVLTDEQLHDLIHALDEEADQDAAALMRLALVTGMRKGALLALRWADCDFERNIITLRGESAKKGTTSFIPMTPAARAILQSIRDKSSEYIFPGRDGGQRSDYRRIARRVKSKANLPDDFRPLHGLRHNFASRLASSGEVELYTLQKLLTHSSPEMTQRYAHLRDETLMKAAKIADKMLDEGND